MKEKKRIRERLIGMRDDLSPVEIDKRSDTIAEKLYSDYRFKKAETIFIFTSFGSEVDTHRIIEELLSMGRSVCIPKIMGKHLMAAVRIGSLEELRPNKFGILEPLEGEEVAPQEIDLIVVPGVAFDRRGYRIGYGGGFYDAFMSRVPEVDKIALAYDLQLIDRIDNESWDIRVDTLITESTTYHFKRIREYGIVVGSMTPGPLNRITDVEGVLVGHTTIDTQRNKTGVSLVIPSRENPFLHKLTASAYVLNGFGKTTGLIQLEELGQLESPIALTNTLCVGRVQDALVGHMIDSCTREGVEPISLNTVVAECNDSYLNDITHRAIEEEHLLKAISNAYRDFSEGDVGGGKGMSCHSLKGGIGSASRIIKVGNREYTLGVLVQSNHGLLSDLTIGGRRIGKDIQEVLQTHDRVDKGSIITIIATDLPLTSRQLKRICKRASVGMARTGSYMGHGSGEIVIGFSTANKKEHSGGDPIVEHTSLREDLMDLPFRGVGEAVEEAILNSMVCSSRVEGVRGARETLTDFMYLI
ncbi:hypothetical protein PM10SUCC1_07150 [Propionigenium maris DSM 9537]|uniref:5-formyltetrahydrofolate cyclo-ligase n=1 Tax=Propionigenium maris DSM 9537 TaxID=1123000 RepID=A0A9W6GJN5_9FUSO|nr:5-formyltetrahydrofolate cyclo-ligase [Propionigenium maris]GLI55200.1 hypothetical protein PM10SUCC1_07150 [Propionigenium maris DSM 9537]